MNNYSIQSRSGISPSEVRDALKSCMLVDGLDLVLDFENSRDVWIKDSKSRKMFFDFFSFFASSPLRINHPKLKTFDFIKKIGEIAATNKPSNSDIYSVEMAEFVAAFRKFAMPRIFKKVFFIDSGTLAVENALKIAFDWKIKKNFHKGYKEEKGTKIIHFREAFHGRSGYTLSLTNTDPNKTDLFPKFKWPRVMNPKLLFPIESNLPIIMKNEKTSINEINEAIKNNPDDIAAIIIEPVQCEGGDNFFRKDFFLKLREIADENDILLIYDEVQTGFGITGRMWAYQHYVPPDIIAFGKKSQVCGVMATDRIEDIEDNCLNKSGRINSTWGGNIVDMVRSKKNLEIMNEDSIVENAERQGAFLLSALKELSKNFYSIISNARGLGLLCAFDFHNAEIRKKFLETAFLNNLLILPCGHKSVRFRPVLDITKNELMEGLNIVEKTLYLTRESFN